MDLELSGKVAFITGGSRGIGKATALALAREGVDVALVGRNEGPLAEAAAEIAKATGRRVIAAPGDTGKRDAVQVAVDRALSAFGRVDILVNNAAVPGGVVKDLSEATEELLMVDINTKVLGYFRCIKAVTPHMQKNGYGRIINIGGLSGRASRNISGLRNAAIAHMTRTLSFQLGPSGITVNLIHPGATRTEATDTAQLHRGATRNAIGRIVDASEIANLACYLASPKAAAITGSVIDCAGGYVNPVLAG